MAVEVARKRPVDDGAGLNVSLPAMKKTRFELEEDIMADIDSLPNGTTAFSPRSLPSTEIDSLAETSKTSKTSGSSYKRPKKYICSYEDCAKAFDRPTKLEEHLRTHTNDRPFVCQEEGCDKAFFKATHLKAHFRYKHCADADFICTYVLVVTESGDEQVCGKAFKTADKLKKHVAAHEEKEDRKCYEPGCGRIFRKMKTLQEHIKKDHLGDEAFRCTRPGFSEEECGQSFPYLSKLKTHQVQVHGGLRYFCEICSPPSDGTTPTVEAVGFRTYNEYQAHLKIVHPPTCTLCHTICASNRALTAHMEIEHSSLASRQTLVCEYPDCGRAFTRRGNLKVHVQNVHVKAKKFVCGVFDLSENEKCPGWNAQTHGCGSGFYTKANLEEHTRTQHLGLESQYHTKAKRKVRKMKEEDPDAVDTPFSMMDLDEPPAMHDTKVPNSQPSTLSLLTGTGYADTRPIACWHYDCPVRFMRQCDLAQHLELKHGWNVDDINDALAEDQEINEEKFWIGGLVDPALITM